jgi:copper ion binding protein
LEATIQPPFKEFLMTTTYRVNGMTCGHCVSSVSSEVSRIDGVTAVDVELETGTVTVTSDQPIQESDVRAAVEEAGYEMSA